MTNWQDWEVPFSGTIDTNSDRKQIPSPNFSAVKNCEFQSRGALAQRRSLKSLSRGIYNTAIQTGPAKGVAAYRDDILMFDNHRMYSRSSSRNNWIIKGPCGVFDSKTTTINNGNKTIFCVSCAYTNGLVAYAYTDFITNTNNLTIVDADNGNILFEAAVAAANLGNTLATRITAVGNNFIIAYKNAASQVEIYRVDTSSAVFSVVNIPALTTTDCVLFGNNEFDLTATGTTSFVLSYRTNISTVKSVFYNITGPVLTVAPTAPAATANVSNAYDAILGRVIVAYGNASDIRAIVYSVPSMAVAIPSDLLVSSGASFFRGVTVTWCGISGGYVVFYEQFTAASPGGVQYPAVNAVNLVGTGAVFTVKQFPPVANGVMLGSKAFYFEDHAYVSLDATHNTVSSGSYLAQVYFSSVFFPQPFLASRVMVGFKAAKKATEPSAGSVAAYTDGSNRFIIASAREFRKDPETLTGLQSTAYSFNSTKGVVSKSAGTNLFVCAGMLNEYDGHELVEQGFHYAPPVVGREIAGGSLASPNVYQVGVIYSWIDANGGRHSSAPTLLSFAPSGAAKSFAIEVATVPSVKNTYEILVYCSQANGTTLTLKDQITVTRGVVAIPDAYRTFTISTVPPTTADKLYTTGGVTPNSSMPSPDMIQEHKNRLFAIVNGRDLYFSKTYSVGTGISMSAAQSFPVPTGQGSSISLGALDDNLVVFNENGALLYGGDGPNDLAIGFFTGPQRILTDTGCDVQSPASVAKIDIGLIFKSKKGYFLLARDFSASEYQEMSGFATQRVSSATLVSAKKQVRFARDGQNLLVYDYQEKRWSEWTTTPKAATVSAGDYAAIHSPTATTSLVVVDSSGYLDDFTSEGLGNVAIPFEFTTGWIHLAGIQGYKRVRRFGIVADNMSSLVVGVSYDYNDNVEDLYTFTGTTTGNSQVRQRLSRQKCEAIRFHVIPTNVPLDSSGPGCVVSSLILEVGTIKGIYRRDG